MKKKNNTNGKKSCENISNQINEELSNVNKEKSNSLHSCSDCEDTSNLITIDSIFDAHLLNTGYDKSGSIIPSGGGLDHNWEFGFGTAVGPRSVTHWAPANVHKHGSWVASPFSNANWITYNHNGSHRKNEIMYFRIRFILNSHFDLNEFLLNMSFYADNSVADVYVNGLPQSIHHPTILPQATGSRAYNHVGFSEANRVDLTLQNDWALCENELSVRVHSGPGFIGFLAQNTFNCYEAEIPKYQPQISVKWGDSDCDCIESDDIETMTLTVCNKYSNIALKNFKIAKIEVADSKGKSVDLLPNGDPSVEIIPKGGYCFGSIESCLCVTREFVLLNRGAKSGEYKIKLSGISYDTVLNYCTQACFEFNICKD